MKRIWILAAVLAFGMLAGCSGKAQEDEVLAPPPPTTASEAPTEQTPPPPQEGQEAQDGSSEAPQAAPIKLYLNGNRLELSTPIQLEGDHVMVPLAEIVSAFSRDIETSAEGETLTLSDTERGNAITITVGGDEAQVNGSAVKLAAPPVLSEDGEMLIELSDFRTLLDADNKYTADISSAYITESGLC